MYLCCQNCLFFAQEKFCLLRKPHFEMSNWFCSPHTTDWGILSAFLMALVMPTSGNSSLYCLYNIEYVIEEEEMPEIIFNVTSAREHEHVYRSCEEREVCKGLNRMNWINLCLKKKLFFSFNQEITLHITVLLCTLFCLRWDGKRDLGIVCCRQSSSSLHTCCMVSAASLYLFVSNISV